VAVIIVVALGLQEFNMEYDYLIEECRQRVIESADAFIAGVGIGDTIRQSVDDLINTVGTSHIEQLKRDKNV